MNSPCLFRKKNSHHPEGSQSFCEWELRLPRYVCIFFRKAGCMVKLMLHFLHASGAKIGHKPGNRYVSVAPTITLSCHSFPCQAVLVYFAFVRHHVFVLHFLSGAFCYPGEWAHGNIKRRVHPNKQIGCFFVPKPRRDESMQVRFLKKEAGVIGWAGSRERLISVMKGATCCVDVEIWLKHQSMWVDM